MKFEGTFNWHGETHTKYCHAANKEQAKILMINMLAKDLKRCVPMVSLYFNGDLANFEIKEIKHETSQTHN